MTSVAAHFRTDDQVILERRSLGFILLATCLSCGLYGLVLTYSHHRVIRALDRRALGPELAILLSMAGYLFTAGLLSFAVDLWQWRCLSEYAAARDLPERNRNLMLFAVAARVGSLLSLWFSWTGLIVFVLVACAIYSTYLTQRELELYTRAP